MTAATGTAGGDVIVDAPRRLRDVFRAANAVRLHAKRTPEGTFAFPSQDMGRLEVAVMAAFGAVVGNK